MVVFQVVLDFDQFRIFLLQGMKVWSEWINAGGVFVQALKIQSGKIVSWHLHPLFVLDLEIKFVHRNL